MNPPAAPQQIGRYLIERELGRGGMAAVFLARDPHMKRSVAIKVLPRQFTFDPQFRARFQREAEVIAALEHPYIVPVYDYGEHDDQPYLVMRYMPGGTLLDRMNAGPLSLPDVARLINRLGEALDEAHAQGIVHRDLKPGNILFDGRGEAFLSDFGIAKLAEAASDLTGTGVLGTPAYMSPEQASGAPNLDGRSDLYSLAVIVYELLTGFLPFKADTPMGLAVAHITQAVPSILTAKPDLPAGMEALMHRALAKAPAERFATAREFAQAVTHLAGGQAAGAVTAAAAPPPTVLPPPAPATSVAVPPPAAAGGLTPLIDLARFTLERTLARHTGTVLGVAFSPDGRWLASAGEDRVIVLWEVETGRAVSLLKGHTQGITGVAFSPDGRLLASSSFDNTVRVWSVPAAQPQHQLAGPAQRVTKGVAFSPDGRWLAAASWDKSVQIWDPVSGQLLRQWEHPALVNGVAFSPDGGRLASASHDKLVRVWDVAAGHLAQTLAGHTDIVSGVAFSADGRTLASASWDRTARLWEAASGAPLAVLAGHTDQVMSVAGGPDGRAAATAGNDRTVRLWADGAAGPVLSGHTDAVKCVAFSRDGRRLASAGADRSVHVWAAA